MSEHKPEWPEAGDLVIATVEHVADYGAYAKLDEYAKQGLPHVSEISSSWTHNIRDFVRENQKLVLKVLRVDSEKARDAKFEFYVIAAPKYSVEVSAENWKHTEDLLQKVGQIILTNVTELGGQGSSKGRNKYGLAT